MPPGAEFVDVFEDVLKHILGPEEVLQLSDIVCISRNKKLYKAKIKIRRFIISNPKKLKDGTFRNELIIVDFTYNQRRELLRRREEASQIDTHFQYLHYFSLI